MAGCRRPGMGLNAYFAFGLVLGQQFSWPQALTAVFITSVLFLLCLFLQPLFASIPGFAPAPALVFVATGFPAPLAGIDWDDLATVVLVMLIAVIMPLTFSIATRIAISFLAYVVIRLISGRTHELNTSTLVITVFGVLWLATLLLDG